MKKIRKYLCKRANIGMCIMYEDLKNSNIIEEFKELVKQAENLENKIDVYSEFMRKMILNTYSEN